MIRTTLVRSALPMRPRPRPLSPPSLSRSTTSSSITLETPVVVTLKHLIPVAGFIVGLAGWAYSGLRHDLSALEKAQHGLDKKVDVAFAKVDVQFSRLEATLVTIKDMITDRDRYASQAEVSNMYRLINVNKAFQGNTVADKAG